MGSFILAQFSLIGHSDCFATPRRWHATTANVRPISRLNSSYCANVGADRTAATNGGPIVR